MNRAGIENAQSRVKVSRFVLTVVPRPAEASLVAGSALLTVLAFPNFDLWFLAWISLTPLLLVIAHAQSATKAFVVGWLWGVIFFYGTCWWLTYPMIHFAGISAWLAYPLFLLPIIVVAFFPALACGLTARVINQFGSWALLTTPLIWVSFEWLRYAITGQLWNALAYSQAFHPFFIQSARLGGVYATGFLIFAPNVAIVFASFRRFVLCVSVLAVGAFCLVLPLDLMPSGSSSSEPKSEFVIAIQPNVPMTDSDDSSTKALLNRHLDLSRQGLSTTGNVVGTRVVVWPESPMNFSYSRDPHLRQVIGDFARTNQASVLLNSLEPASAGGNQNSAILVNEKGEMSARYDKIRLMPFGEYVPLPRWLPGASSVRGLVGEFKPGSSYTLMPLGAIRAGVFICIEAAHPGIARNFANQGADVLINISNDGYLGPTPVMRQHLANAVFRAVENDRDLIRVTNTGITAYISANGTVQDQTGGFQESFRTWTISQAGNETTFYTRHGDVFAYTCALISLGFISASFMRRRVVRKPGHKEGQSD